MTPCSLFSRPSWVLLILMCIPCSLGFLPLHPRVGLSGNSRALLLLNNNNNNLVLCVGDALLDCIATDEARGWSVDKMVLHNAWNAFPGGAPANVATALMKLGTPSAFCGCIGMDDDGDLLESILTNEGVNISLLQRTSKMPTRRVLVTRSLEGDREFGGFSDNRAADEFADCLLDAPNSSQAKELLQQCTWMVCSTLSLAFPKSNHAITQIGKTSTAKQCPIAR